MKYQEPKIYRIYPPGIGAAACINGDAAGNPASCVAGPEANSGCEAGAAAGSKCNSGAAAFGKCESGTGN
ncbi:MAG: hypothetical protein ABIA04_16385 [Pseudomonadota bacterium]